MSTNFPALALFVFTSATLSAQAEPVKPDGSVDVSKTADGKLQVQARALVRQIAPGDPFRVALHFSRVGEKVDDGQPPDTSIVLDIGKTWAGMRFIVTTPAGKKHELAMKWRGEARWGERPIYEFASPVLVIDRTGILIATHYGDTKAEWKERALDLGETGKYTLEIKGELVGAKTTFTTGKLTFDVAPATQAIKEAFEKASVALDKKFPGIDFRKDVGTIGLTELGFVFEDAKDRRLLFFAAILDKKAFFSFDLVRVAITRKGEVVEIAHRRVGTCIAAGTPIETPEGPRPIETLQEGDAVWSFDLAAAKQVKTKIQSKRSLLTNSTLLIGKSLRITANHPLYVNGAWLPAGQASLGDRLLTAEGKPVVIGEIREKRGSIEVFDLTVDEPHNYFAGGFLVHNKSRPWSASLDDTWHFFWPENPKEWKID